jgi:hypothetical protein
LLDDPDVLAALSGKECTKAEGKIAKGDLRLAAIAPVLPATDMPCAVNAEPVSANEMLKGDAFDGLPECVYDVLASETISTAHARSAGWL